MGRECSGTVQVLLETNTAGNLQLVVQVAKEYTEQLGAGKIMELLESHKSYHGLYYYLGGHIAFSEDPEVHLGSLSISQWCCQHWQLFLAESGMQGQGLNDGFRMCASVADDCWLRCPAHAAAAQHMWSAGNAKFERLFRDEASSPRHNKHYHAAG